MLDVYIYIYCLVLSLIFNFVLFNQKKKLKMKKNSVAANSAILYYSKEEEEEEENKWSWINKVLIWELDLGALVDFVDIRGFGFMMPLYSLYVSFHLLGCLKCVCPPLHKQLALFIAYFLHSPVTKNPQILIWK